MEESQKFSTNKEVIAFLVERFPACFTAKGAAHPLKIGIFDDLSSQLGEEAGLSKTRLRAALRHYTSSWRYLRSIKPGAMRVDLDGKPCGEVEQQHVDHARQTLEESLAKHGKLPQDDKPKRKPRPQPRPSKASGEQGGENKRKPSKVKNKGRTERAPLKPVDPAELKVDSRVSVKFGKSVVPGTIVEISKDEVQVQLNSGMLVKVQPEHIVA